MSAIPGPTSGDQELGPKPYSVLLLACEREAEAANGDMSYYRYLADLRHGAIQFCLSPRSPRHLLGEGRRRILHGIVARASTPPSVRRYLVRSSRRANYVSRSGGRTYDAVLGHLTAPMRPLPAPRDFRPLPAIWTSQGLAERSYYEGPYGSGATLEDVIGLYAHVGTQVDALVSWTESGADNLRHHCPKLGDRLRVIHPPVAGPEELPFKPSTMDGRLRVLFVGVDRQRKGLSDLETAVTMVSGALRERLLVQVLGASPPSGPHPPCLHYLGATPRHTVSQLMTEGDLIVLPSWADTYGMAVAEGMAYGCAAIVSTIPVLKELVEDGVSGVHVEAGAPAEIAYALETLAGDEPLLRALQAGAFSAYLRRNAPPVVCREFRRLLDELI
jgi:glycosyltransferase involved in cell wall biosynthesis